MLAQSKPAHCCRLRSDLWARRQDRFRKRVKHCCTETCMVRLASGFPLVWSYLGWQIWVVGSTATGRNGRTIDKSRLSETIMRAAPADIKLKRAEGILEISWRDEPAVRYNARQLRCECACAGCVDERTGVRTLDSDSVPDNVGITHIELVGNYALQLSFSDGHNTGIYSWDRLHRMQSAG